MLFSHFKRIAIGFAALYILIEVAYNIREYIVHKVHWEASREVKRVQFKENRSSFNAKFRAKERSL